jgi:hypothetical protein
MQFGEPHLFIRQPIVARHSKDDRVKANLARRRVYVHGAWDFFVWECDWEVVTRRGSATRQSDAATLKQALEELDGQILKSVDTGEVPLSWIFKFDLEGEFRFKPIPGSPEDLWSLQTKDRKMTVCHADGTFVPGDKPVYS